MLTSVSVSLALTLITLAISLSTMYFKFKLYKFTLDAPTVIKLPNEPVAARFKPFNSTFSESMTKAILFKSALSPLMVIALLRIIKSETLENVPLKINSLNVIESLNKPSSSK